MSVENNSVWFSRLKNANDSIMTIFAEEIRFILFEFFYDKQEIKFFDGNVLDFLLVFNLHHIIHAFETMKYKHAYGNAINSMSQTTDIFYRYLKIFSWNRGCIFDDYTVHAMTHLGKSSITGCNLYQMEDEDFYDSAPILFTQDGRYNAGNLIDKFSTVSDKVSIYRFKQEYWVIVNKSSTCYHPCEKCRKKYISTCGNTCHSVDLMRWFDQICERCSSDLYSSCRHDCRQCKPKLGYMRANCFFIEPRKNINVEIYSPQQMLLSSQNRLAYISVLMP